MKSILTLLAVSAGWLAGCATYRESPKYQFMEGVYRARLGHQPRQRLYVASQQDSILTGYGLVRQQGRFRADTATRQQIVLMPQARSAPYRTASFAKSSLDIDILTTLVKYRPGRGEVPVQFNPTFNASVFAGRRTDVYRIRYATTPLGGYRRRQIHYGLSFGVFSGLGGTAVNPTTTAGGTALEYDGVVWQNGAALVVGIENVTFGINVGTDRLLDRNRSVWLYHRKPWLGLVVGLNLN